jgi:hypothetical protein
MQSLEAEEEEKRNKLANRCFQDIPFIQRFPLVHPSAVLQYFSISPFFDISSNNQILVTQGLEQSIVNLQQMRGVEFVVDEKLSQPPNLFVILKQYRSSPRLVESLEVYYCLNGSIFQCPDLLDVIRTRFGKIVLSLRKAHDCLFEDQQT